VGQELQGDQDLHAPDELKRSSLKDPRSILMSASRSTQRHTVEDQRNGKVLHRRHVAGHGVRQDRDAAVRYGAPGTRSMPARRRKAGLYQGAVTLDDQAGTTDGLVVAVANTYCE